MRQPIEYRNLNRIEYRSKLVLLQTASNLVNKYLFSFTIAYICLHCKPVGIFLVKVYGLQFKMDINKTLQILYSNIAFTQKI